MKKSYSIYFILTTLSLLALIVYTVSAKEVVEKTSNKEVSLNEGPSETKALTPTNITLASTLDGVWKCTLEDGSDLKLIYSKGSDKLLLISKMEGCYNYEITNKSFSDSSLNFSINIDSDEVSQSLRLQDNTTLMGTSIYKNNNDLILFHKISDTPTIYPFSTNEFLITSKSFNETVARTKGLPIHSSYSVK